MAVSVEPALSTERLESLERKLHSFLATNALNRDFFDGDVVFLRRANSLFDARAIEDVQDFALVLWQGLLETLMARTVDWLVVYPLYRITAPTAPIEADGVSLLNTEDIDSWEVIAADYPNARAWDPRTGKVRGDESLRFSSSAPTWLLCKASGFWESARHQAAQRMRTFISVLFSHLHQEVPDLLWKGASAPSRRCVQFASDTKAGKGCLASTRTAFRIDSTELLPKPGRCLIKFATVLPDGRARWGGESAWPHEGN